MPPHSNYKGLIPKKLTNVKSMPEKHLQYNDDLSPENSFVNILKERLESFSKNPELSLKQKNKDYQKKWSEAVEFFRIKINQDRRKAKQAELPYIAIRQKLVALKEIDDLRWFYLQCVKYSNTYQKLLVNGKPVRNTFSRCFFGALK